jgi:hypothetical protein
VVSASFRGNLSPEQDQPIQPMSLSLCPKIHRFDHDLSSIGLNRNQFPFEI